MPRFQVIQPLKKDKKETKRVEVEKEIKTTTKLGIIVPKNKPKIVSKKIKTAEVKSKYFSKKKFRLARKSIEAFEKGSTALVLGRSITSRVNIKKNISRLIKELNFNEN